MTAIAPGHAATLGFFQREGISFSHPLLHLVLRGGGGPRLDDIALIQFPLILGITAGGTISALLLREFRIYARAPGRQYLSALCGGVIMGVASRLGPACNIWHLTGGLPVLALQSILFVAGLLPGTLVGAKLLVGMVLKEG